MLRRWQLWTASVYRQLPHDKLSSKVDRISVAIKKPGTVFTPDDTKVWAFGFTGNIHVIDGIVHAESESTLTSSNYVTIMCRFPRDMFDTENLINKSFSTMMKKAKHAIPDTFEASARLADKWADSKLVKKHYSGFFRYPVICCQILRHYTYNFIYCLKIKKLSMSLPLKEEKLTSLPG